jgi:hypothetical protein
MRLIAATLDPATLDPATLDPATLTPESTWYLATSLSLEEASPEVVSEWYRLRDGIENRQPHYLDRTPVAASWAASSALLSLSV